MLLGSLRGLRVQILLWTVLPLTLALIAVAVLGINAHQRAMRELVEELNARSARLAATHLSDELAGRAAILQQVALHQELTPSDSFAAMFDGGLARFDSAGKLLTAFPSIEVWQARPVDELLKNLSPGEINKVAFSPIFVDPRSNKETLLIATTTSDGGLVVGAVSLAQLGLTEIVAEVIAATEQNRPGQPTDEAVAFLVNTNGEIIYHPDPTRVGQNLQSHEGVAAILRGQAGATYRQEPGGQELAVGYAPVDGPGWGLIVQEPWEALIAPVMRFSLLTPLVVVAAALVSGLAVTFGLHYVVRPLQMLDRQATQVAWGNFEATNKPVGGVQEIEDLRRTLASMAEQIQRYQSGMRDYIAAVTLAQEEERKRLARELHDETVQSLIALGHRVEMTQKIMKKDPERAKQRLADLRVMVGDIQAEVRRFSRALRPLYLEDLGFVPALEMLAQETERDHNLTVLVEIEGDVRRLPHDLELAVYRIAQEALSNVVRHAEAKTVWLNTTFVPNGLTLRVRDDGCGFTPPLNPSHLANLGHFGLMGIHERALLFGGQTTISSQSGAGTTLEVFLPLS